NVVDEGKRAQFAILFRPYIHHSTKLVSGQSRDRQVMARRKTNYPADAGFALRHNQPIAIHAAIWSIRHQRWVVVVKDKCVAVVGIANSGSSQVSWAHVAGGIVSRWRPTGQLIDFPQPRPLRTLGRNQHPFVSQRIEATMRML